MSTHGVDKINILQIVTNLSAVGGIEETLRLLCSELDHARFRVGLCSIKDHLDDIHPVFKSMDIDLFCLNRRGFLIDPVTTLSLRRVIREFHADIVHTHRDKANLHGRLAAILCNKPSITTYHSMRHVAYSPNDSLKERKNFHITCMEEDPHRPNLVDSTVHPRLAKLLNHKTARVIGVSDAVRSVYCQDPGDPRYVTVHAPYDEKVFRMDCRELPGKTITLGSVGRLSTPKGFLFLLQAIKLLRDAGRDVRLKIKGTGERWPVLESYIFNNSLDKIVTLCGNQPHGRALYEDMDIYIQPSISEACSITLLEAMGCGLPVIASDIDGPRELIISGRHGLLVPPRDPAALADAVERMIDDKQMAHTLAREGQVRACENFSSRHFIQKMEGLYLDVVSERSG